MLIAAIAAVVAFTITATGVALLDRKAPAKASERGTAYTGPLYTVHGREVA